MVLCEGDTLTAEEFPANPGAGRGRGIRGVMLPTGADAGTRPLCAPKPRPYGFPRLPVAKAKAERQVHFGLLRALDERGNVRSLSEVELEMIRLAIDHYQGQMSEVARRLGIGRSTLYRKLKEYGIDPETGRADAWLLNEQSTISGVNLSFTLIRTAGVFGQFLAMV